MSDAAKQNASFDLADLLEYDEFDGDEDVAYNAIAAAAAQEDTGVPLSVELNESINQPRSGEEVHLPLAVDDPVGFPKGAEIFLRIDSNDDASCTHTTTTITTASGSQTNNKLSIESRTVSDGPSSSSGQYSLSLDGDAMGDAIGELQYENEFVDSNDDEEDEHFGGGGHRMITNQSSHHHHHHLHRRPAVENDNEQLLFEGIFLLLSHQIEVGGFCFYSVVVYVSNPLVI